MKRISYKNYYKKQNTHINKNIMEGRNSKNMSFWKALEYLDLCDYIKFAFFNLLMTKILPFIN